MRFTVISYLAECYTIRHQIDQDQELMPLLKMNLYTLAFDIIEQRENFWEHFLTLKFNIIELHS
jgi:hypothetical protein